jgi:hypothetical protein
MQALIEEEVARGMEPYRRLGLPTDVLDELEHMLRFALSKHPTAQVLLRRLCDDPVVVKSDGVDTAGLEEALQKDRGRDHGS